MKNLLPKLIAICLVLFFYDKSTTAQNIFPPAAPVGIGTLTPTNQLEVTQGDINIAPFGGTNFGYKIGTGAGSPYVIWHNGIISSIYVGVGAGNGFPANTVNNTFVGSNTGANNAFSGTTGVTGMNNTFVGANSGLNNDQGYLNCFFGINSGQANTGGHSNVFIGNSAGFSNTGGLNNGSWNTIVGHVAGYLNTTGLANCFYGKYSGHDNVDGVKNAFYGSHSGEHTGALSVLNKYNSFFGGHTGQFFNSGEYNLFLGYNSQNVGTAIDAWNNISNAVTIGSNTVVPGSNQMILGTNGMKVGIGLSGTTASGNNGPQKSLEINADPASYIYTGVNGSGLRFRQLTSLSNTVPSNNKVLTVNVDGDVVLTNDQVGIGNVTTGSCPSSTTINYIPKFSVTNTTICNSQIFDNGTQVGVATNTPSTTSRMTVNGNHNLTNFTDAYFIGGRKFLASDGNSNQWNIYLGLDAGPPGVSVNSGYGNIAIGNLSAFNLNRDPLYNIMIGVEAGNKTAGSGFTEASRNVFVGSKAGFLNTTGHENVYLGHWAGRGNRLTYTSRNVIIGNISGSFNGEEGEDNVLLGNNTHLDITGLRINHSCAIGADANVHGNFSMAVGSGSNVFTDNSISMGRVESDVTLMGYNANPSTGGFRLYVNPLTGTDAAYFNGDINCNGTWYPSDSALKKNILSLNPQDANQLIDLLNPKTYVYDLLNNPSLHLPSGVQYGFLAQELEGVLPSLVKEVTAPPILDSIGQVIYPEKTFKSINYTALIPLLIQYGKNQKTEIDSLKSIINDYSNRFDKLESLINNCCIVKSHLRLSNSTDIAFNNEKTIILNQNDPNPFSEHTTITYNIPSTVSEAKIIFFDNSQRILQSINILERGPGQITVYAEKLSTGTYLYSLIADGIVVETKKMVCSK